LYFFDAIVTYSRSELHFRVSDAAAASPAPSGRKPLTPRHWYYRQAFTRLAVCAGLAAGQLMPAGQAASRVQRQASDG